jgi:hypothetical protein
MPLVCRGTQYPNSQEGSLLYASGVGVVRCVSYVPRPPRRSLCRFRTNDSCEVFYGSGIARVAAGKLAVARRLCSTDKTPDLVNTTPPLDAHYLPLGSIHNHRQAYASVLLDCGPQRRTETPHHYCGPFGSRTWS